MSRRLLIPLIFVFVFWFGPAMLGLITDWLWFADLGFLPVYRTRLLTQGGLFALGSAVSLGLILGGALLADRLSRRAVGHVEFASSAQIRAMEPTFRLAVLGGGLFLALMTAGTLAGHWSEVLQFLRPTAFDATDPLFGRDIGFFVFSLPVYRTVQGWLVMVVVMALAASIGVYAFRILLPQLPTTLMDSQDAWAATSIRVILTRPMRAYFGQKDYQQVLVVKQLVQDLQLPLTVRVLPTVREPDGLAMSSRNMYLTSSQRAHAAVLYHALSLARRRIRAGERRAAPILRAMRRLIHRAKDARIDYLVLADAITLKPQQRLHGRVAILVAVWVGRTRLIDNLLVEVS